MGFQNIQTEIMPLWEQLRDDFPVARKLVYLNHASIAPLCRPAAEAMARFSEDAMVYGSLHYDVWLAAYDRLRLATARLINSSPSEIAIVKNTSEGISTVANGISWKAGNRVVAFTEEFPANFFPWKKLEAKGVQVVWLSVHDPLDRIDEAAAGARLLAISYVQYVSGLRANLNAIGEICRRRNVFFFVDAIQGLGVFPVDVETSHIDALAADGHKWLLGPEGCGVLYVRKERQDQIEPVEFGWTNVAGFNDYRSRDLALREDAGRYECGTLNTIGCFGLAASIEYLLDLRVERLGPAVQVLADRIAEGAEARGYQVMLPRTPETSSGIVSVRKAGIDSQAAVDRLKLAGIVAAQRHGWLRASPHCYLSPEQIDQALEALP